MMVVEVVSGVRGDCVDGDGDKMNELRSGHRKAGASYIQNVRLQ